MDSPRRYGSICLQVGYIYCTAGALQFVRSRFGGFVDLNPDSKRDE